MRIKIVEPGWAGYTGIVGIVQFEEGVSIEEVSRAEADRIGATLRVETLEGKQVNAAQTILDMYSNKAPEERRTLTPEGEPQLPPQKKIESVEEPPAHAVARIWTAEDLGELADQGGINALREVAEPLGVKATAIKALIEKILEAQATAAAS
jgi:hypothetical protein